VGGKEDEKYGKKKWNQIVDERKGVGEGRKQ
jgi:hypothetical protein